MKSRWGLLDAAYTFTIVDGSASSNLDHDLNLEPVYQQPQPQAGPSRVFLSEYGKCNEIEVLENDVQFQLIQGQEGEETITLYTGNQIQNIPVSIH